MYIYKLISYIDAYNHSCTDAKIHVYWRHRLGYILRACACGCILWERARDTLMYVGQGMYGRWKYYKAEFQLPAVMRHEFIVTTWRNLSHVKDVNENSDNIGDQTLTLSRRNRYLKLFDILIRRTGSMFAQWIYSVMRMAALLKNQNN